MSNRYLRIDSDAIEPTVEALWSAILDAKASLIAALAADLDDQVSPRLTVLQAQILSLLARPAGSHDDIRRKMTAMEFVRVFEPWFPTRAGTMGEHAIQADLEDLGASLEDLMGETVLQ